MAASFPMAFVDPIVEAVQRVFDASSGVGTFNVVPRPLGSTDRSRTVGVFPVDSTGNIDDKSMGVPNREPFIHKYRLRIENMHVSGDQEVGRREFSIDSKAIRAILYRDTAFALAFLGLEEDFMGTVESVIQYDITKQEYVAGPSSLGFRYVAITEVLVTTQQSHRS